MRILIIEDRPGQGGPAGRRLVDAGHAVTTCSTPQSPLGCRGLVADERCPFDEAPIDAAVLAAGAGGEPADGRLPVGERCARRQHVPIVAMGSSATGDHLRLDAVVDDINHLVDVVERTVHQPLTEHSDAARRAVRATFDRHDLHDVDVRVSVERRDGRLRVHAVPGAPVPPFVAQVAAVRAAGAVRAVDPAARAIGVNIDG